MKEVARTLEPGGRFAFTVKEGPPLTRPERSRMPAADTVGEQATAELITGHQLWSDWLGSGRVRKFAIVAEKR